MGERRLARGSKQAGPWTAPGARPSGQRGEGRGPRGPGTRRTKGRGGPGAHLIAPLEHVLVPVLDCVVDVQELEDPVPPHVVGVALGLLPAQRRALGQQPHGRPLSPPSGPAAAAPGSGRAARVGRSAARRRRRRLNPGVGCGGGEAPSGPSRRREGPVPSGSQARGPRRPGDLGRDRAHRADGGGGPEAGLAGWLALRPTPRPLWLPHRSCSEAAAAGASLCRCRALAPSYL